MASQENILSGPESVEFDHEIGLVPKMFYNIQKATNDIFSVNIDTDEVITYKQLWDKTIKVASALQSLGLGFGKVLALIAENDLESYSVYFGAVFTGASVGCINHTFSPGEIKQLFTTLLPDFVFCSKETFEITSLALEGVEKKPVVIVPGGRVPDFLDYYDFLKYPNSFRFPTLPSWDDHIPGILFSSGSTGLPKGTMIKDKSLQYMQRVIPPYLKDILTQFPLCAGSSIIFLTAAVKYMGTYFYGGKTSAIVRKAIIKYKPTYWFNSPSNLLKLAQEPDFNHEDLSSIQIIYSSGAGLTKDQIIYLNKKLLNNRIGIVNSYNCIEALAITNWPEGSDLINSPKIGSVGKLHPFLRLKVIDMDNGKNLGPGCEGEFYVHTPFIMAGYLNCPKETAEVLDAEGWYRTGDVGYYDEDGYVFVTGRVKEIFKCMNRQVSPAQLEAILEEHPAVFEAVIVGTPHPIDGYHPTAFVALKKDVPPVDADELIKFVNDQVADYRKLYGGVYFVDKIPTTASGKKLRNKLLERLVQ